MLNGLRNEILEMNNDINNVSNSKKAKRLRRVLLIIGTILAIVGYGSTFACFALFTINSFNGVKEGNGFGLGVIIPFILFIPSFLIGGFGVMLIKLGLSIIVTGYASNYIDERVALKCPECGDIVSKNELFCTKCGKKVRIQCEECGCINNIDDKFCAKCGHEL